MNRKRILVIGIITMFVFISASQFLAVSGSSATTVRWDWLTLDIGDDKSDKVFHVPGSFSLFNLESLGVYAQDENGVLFDAEATFGAEIISFLGLSLRDCYADIDLDKKVGITFVSILFWAGWYPFPGVPSGTGAVKFYMRDIEFGELNTQSYSGSVPITFGINPTYANLAGTTVAGVKIDKVIYAFEVKSVSVVNQLYGEVGDYMDIYTEQTRKSGSLSTLKIDQDSPSQAKIASRIEKLNLGWKTDDSPQYIKSGITIQQMITYAPPIGTTYTNTGTGNIKFDYSLKFQPEITKTTQEVEVRKCDIVYEKNIFGDAVHALTAVQEKVVERTRSVHIDLPYTRETFEIKVRFLATVKLDFEKYESKLNDPIFQRGDWLWNDEPGSGKGELVTERTWLEEFWYVIVIILLIVGALCIVWIYFKRKGKKITVQLFNQKNKF